MHQPMRQRWRPRRTSTTNCRKHWQRRRDILIVTGDFNAKIGKDNTGRERIMGKEGSGTMNENGEMFVDFCVFNNLVIGGSVFQHKDIHKGTWVSPDHPTVNQIDHITIDKKFRRSLQDTRVRRGADVASDHHLLVGQVRLKLKKCLPQGSKAGRKFNTIYLNDRALKSTFKLTLSNRFQALGNCEDDPVETMWETAKQVWKSTFEEVLGKKSRTQKEWLAAATMRVVDKRRDQSRIEHGENKSFKSKAIRGTHSTEQRGEEEYQKRQERPCRTHDTGCRRRSWKKRHEGALPDHQEAGWEEEHSTTTCPKQGWRDPYITKGAVGALERAFSEPAEPTIADEPSRHPSGAPNPEC